MSKEYTLQFNLYNYISAEEPYLNDTGAVVLGVVNDDSGILKVLFDSYKTEHIKFFIELIKYVSDLEAKLAEKDLRIEELESQFAYECECNKQFVECQNENEKLKQQLAESEEKINMLEEHKFYADNIIQAYADKCKQHNQDKISFAVEQIMQIREKIDNSEKIGIGLTLDGIYEIDNIFDNQIAELTHQQEDKGE